MKKRNFLFGALAALAMMGCSDNEIEKDNGFAVPEDGVVYAKISIAMPGNGIGGRAFGAGEGEFDLGTDGTNGTVDENSINKLLFVFYSKGGLVLAHTSVEGEKLNGMLPDGGQQISGDHKYMYQGVVPVKLDRTVTERPAYVMVYANPQDENNLRSPLIDVRKSAFRSNYKTDNGFTMNNSVYYDKDGNLVVATPVSEKDFKETEAEAKAASSNTTVYLERMAVKVKVKKGQTLAANNKPVEVAGNKYLVFDIDNATWGLSGTEKEMFLVKYLPENKPTNWDWAFPSGDDVHRSYWALSYSYVAGNNVQEIGAGNSDAKFPMYGDDVDTEEKTKEYALKYIKYTDAQKKFGDIDYCLENTSRPVKYNDPDNWNKYATMTYVLICGKYKVAANADGTGTVDGFPEGKTFYYFNDALYNSEENVVAAMYVAQNLIYTDAECTTVAGKDKFELVHRDGKQSSSRYELQLNSTGIEALYYRSAPNAEPMQLNTIENVSAANDALAMTIPSAIKYNESKAFFAVPIEHHSGLVEGAAVNGTYGVVRNHSYVLTINSISGLANGVDGNEPLIPTPSENVTYWVGADIHTLHWHVVNQSVDLK